MAINLIPQEQIQKNSASSFSKRMIFYGLMTVIVSASVIGVQYTINFFDLNSLKSQENIVISKEANLKDYQEAYNKYKNHRARPALVNHVYFSNLLNTFLKTVPEEVKITSLSFNNDFKANLSGEAFGGLISISAFEENLRNEGFSNVFLRSVSLNNSQDSSSVIFSLTFDYNVNMIKDISH